MTNLNSHSSIQNSFAVKGLYATNAQSHHQAAKTLAGAAQSGNADVYAWRDTNQHIYDVIAAGRNSHPPLSDEQIAARLDFSLSELAQFEEWWSWTDSQVGGWDPMSMEPMDADVGMAAAGQFSESVPFGGTKGAFGTYCYTDEKFRGGFIGEGTYDIWSTDVLLQIAPTSARQITIDNVMDSRLNPAREVRKITVKDEATGTTAIYYIQDPAAKVEVQCPNPDLIVDNTGTVEKNKFVPGTLNAEASNESSVEGIEENGQLVYEGRVGETIEFKPTGNGSDQEHVVWGNADITVGTRDRVAVYASEIADPSHDGEMIPATKIVVNHPDGSSDTYFIPQGMDFKTNINCIESRITWGTPGLETDYADFVTFNAGGVEGEEAIEVDGDAPTSVDGNERTFDSGASVDMYTRKDGGVSTVYARNDVTLHASSNQEYWVVSWDFENQRYVVEVYADETKSALKETIYIDNMADAIKLDIDPSHLEFAGSLMVDLHPNELNTSLAEAEKIQIVGADGDAESTPAQNWPTVDIVANVPTSWNEGYNGEQYNRALDIVNLINTAIHSGRAEDWAAVSNFINNLSGAAAGRKDNIVRHVLTAIFKAAGQDQDRFMELLGMIDDDVIRTMRSTLNTDYTEKADDESFNSATFGAMLDESLAE